MEIKIVLFSYLNMKSLFLIQKERETMLKHWIADTY